MNPLTNALRPRTRKRLYALYALLALALGATQTGYGTAGTEIPTWLSVVLAVFAYVGTFLGLTAASNVTDTGQHAAGDEGEVDVSLLLLITILIGVVYLIVKLT